MANRFASRPARRRYLSIVLGILWLACLAAPPAPALELSRAEAAKIGRKIWQNECGGTIAGLTSWNSGENFASLGIGHFIWYPKGVSGPFDESFPVLVDFMKKRGADLPPIIRENLSTGCPWPDRASFVAASDSPEVRALRRFLANTIDLQAAFLVERLERALPKMLARAPAGEREELRRKFEQVGSTPQGCYALVDYVNFKGEGVLESERYKGQGWGLLQVLQAMPATARGAEAAREFAAAARRVLTRRVQNSPPERRESRWLPGWTNRVNTYAADR